MSAASGLSRVILRLGRNPDQGAPDGDDHRGYVLVAPLDADGFLDPKLWAEKRDECTVRRFHPTETAADGWLRHANGVWRFWYDEADEGPEEPGVGLGDHRFRPGEYVTIRERGGEPLAFRVDDVQYLP